jgi:hypothetical protein
MPDRAELLARAADDYMAAGALPLRTLPGCTDFRVSLWPPAGPTEVHFSAAWPSVTLVCKRSLAGYSLEGGLHRA